MLPLPAPAREPAALALLGLTLATFATAGGCGHSSAIIPPPGTTLVRLARVDPGGAFAVDGWAARVAFVQGGRLWLLERGPAARGGAARGGTAREIGRDAPTRLAWSPGGRLGAAVLEGAARTRLRIHDDAGAVLATAVVAGRVGALAWRGDDELLALAIELTRFRFGGHVRGALHRLALPAGRVATTALWDSTLKRRSLDALAERAHETAQLALAPQGDEILYTQLRDPPAFPLQIAVALRHLDAGAERTLARLSPAARLGGFAPDGERVLYSDGEAATTWVDPWSGAEAATVTRLPHAGRELACSPDGRHVLVDGVLLADGRPRARFAEGGGPSGFTPPGGAAMQAAPKNRVRGAFLRGGGLVLAAGEELVLLAGIGAAAASGPALSPAARERRRALRRWRAQGLITSADYRTAAREVGR